jgi:hypothetical protein
MKAIKKVNLLVVTLILVAAIEIQAQWATDVAVNNPVSTATGAQRYVQSVSDGSGGVIIAWEDYRSGTADIYAQRINSSGVAQWTTNGVAISVATGEQSRPVIIYDNTGGAIIAWQDLRSGTSYDIYAQRINSAGAVQWTANGVAVSTATLNQQKPVITLGPSGGATIAWEDNRTGGTGTDFDIYAQRLNSSGAVQWAADGVVVCAAIGAQGVPNLVGIGSGTEVILTWQDYRGGATPDIYAQKVNTNGVVLWTSDGVVICTATNGQFNPAIINDGNSGIGGAIITWEDNRSGNSDIYVQRVNGSGVAQWTSNGVAVSVAVGNQIKAKLAPTAGSEAIITWEDARSGTADIYVQRINSAGVVQWTADGVAICTSNGAQTNPQIVSGIASDFSNGAIITWEDQRSATYDIYAQQVNSNGVVQWTNNGVAISTAPNEQSSPSIVFDSFDLLPSKNGAIVSWDDNRSGNFDIYAQRVSLSGVLCGNASTPGAISGTQTILAGSSNTYSVAAVVGATSYTWTLPTGWTGTSTTNSITAIASATSGNVSVTASNACGTSASVSLAITVNKQNQTITFNTLSSKAMGDAAFDLTATASSTLPISYASSNTSVATISGSTVTLVGVGTTTITASQNGNDIFNAAPNVLRDLVVNKGNQTITFAALPSKAVGDAPFALTATSSSGLAIEYTSSNTSIATISGSTVALLAPGSVTINANQAGNANYNAATQVSQTFCVNPAKPTITATGVNTESPTLSSTATSGNQWFLNDVLITGATNATLAVAAPGIYKVQVTTGGCTSAFSDNFTFVITGDESFASSKSQFSIYPNPTFDRLTVSLPNDYQNKEVSIYTNNGQRVDFNETSHNEVQFDVTGYAPGVYLIKMSSARANGIIRFTKQ